MFGKNFFVKTSLAWVPFAAMITSFCLLVYAVAQHDVRSGANDPQIQMAEDAAALLASGAEAPSVLPKDRIDISKSIAPYIIIFDNQGHIFSSSASLHGKPPVVPSGVFANAQQQGELRFTWEPEAGVRQAVVLVSFSGGNSGFVLAGRSLREAEYRIDDLGFEVIIAWTVTLTATFIVLWVVICFLDTSKKKRKK